MSIPVERPSVHSADEQRSSESASLPSKEIEAVPEPSIHDRNWGVLGGLLNKRSLLVLTRYAFKFTHNVQDAEDVVSETMCRAVGMLHQLREEPTEGRVNKFLRTTIRNLAVDYGRRNRCRRKYFGSEPNLDASDSLDSCADAAPDPQSVIRSKVEDERVWAALATLPEASRHVAILRFIWEYSVEEIALRRAIQPSTVRKHLEIARRSFRQHFPREGGDHVTE